MCILLVGLIHEITNKRYTNKCFWNFNTFKDYSETATHLGIKMTTFCIFGLSNIDLICFILYICVEQWW